MNHSLCIAPSLLSANFLTLQAEVQELLHAGADWLHYDVMDNHFVPNLSFGPAIFGQLRAAFPKAFFDVHLMIDPVIDLAKKFQEQGADLISFHPETTKDVLTTLKTLRKTSKTGLVFNPETPLTLLESTDIMREIDLILIMGVHPGFGGQAIIPSTIAKLQQAKQIIHKFGLTNPNQSIRLEFDGGVHWDNIPALKQAGANVLVAGSLIFKSNNYQQTIAKMRHA